MKLKTGVVAKISHPDPRIEQKHKTRELRNILSEDNKPITPSHGTNNFLEDIGFESDQINSFFNHYDKQVVQAAARITSKYSKTDNLKEIFETILQAVEKHGEQAARYLILTQSLEPFYLVSHFGSS